jgi:hypothetical protein
VSTREAAVCPILEQSAERVEAAGGVYRGQINVGEGPKTERKYRDPNGLVFDITTAEHARAVWCIPDGLVVRPANPAGKIGGRESARGDVEKLASGPPP